MNIGRITARYKNIVLENKILVERALGTLGLLRMWYYIITALRNEASPLEKRNDWALLQKAADAVDVKLLLDGEIPKEEKTESILIMAIHECLTNTVKHAGGGNELYIKLRNTGDGILAEMRNNRNPPSHTVKESGGLFILYGFS